MRRISAWILAIAVVAGVAASAVAYARTSPGLPHATSTPAAATSDARQQPTHAVKSQRPAATKVRWAPCAPGTRLEGNVCVREVVHTVTLPAPPAPRTAPSSAPAPAAPASHPAAATPAAPAPAAPSASTATTAPTRDDHTGEHEREHEGEHEGGHGDHAGHDD
jgi:hypothetical protein